MHEDTKVQERLRSAWDEVPVTDPDIAKIRRRGSRKRIGRSIGAVVAGVFVVGALVIPLWSLSGLRDSTTSPGDGGPALSPVPDSREWVTVDAQEALHQSQDVIDQLAEAGINAAIIEVPVDPVAEGDMHVGGWNQVVFGQASAISDGDFRTLADGNFGRRELSLPSPIAGPVTLFVNRLAREGEVPWFFNSSHQTNELSPTGTFWCLALEEMTPSEATSTLQSLGYQVRWLHVDGQLGMYRTSSMPEDGELVFSFLSSPDTADLRFADAADAEHAREAFGTPSQKYPRSSWSGWANCRA